MSIPVTVVSIPPNRVTQVRLPMITVIVRCRFTVKLTLVSARISKIPKPQAGHFVKSGVGAGSGLWGPQVV